MHVYPPVGRCIYCGKSQDELPSGFKLTKEHIIPSGLRGDLILPGASCKAPERGGGWSCSAQTGRFEGQYLREANDGLRTYLGVFGNRRKRERRTEIPFTISVPDQDGKEIPLHSLRRREDSPLIALFAVFHEAELLSGQKSDRLVYFKPIPVAEQEKFKPFVGNWIHSPGQFQGSWTIQLLAKIAHSYAVAEYGADTFPSFLPGIILAEDLETTEWYKYIGCLVL